MSVDGSATIFCSTPLRVPVVELLRDKDAVGSTSDGAAMPAADGPCPVCPLLEEKLKATREAAYWRVMHHRATEREAKLKLRIAKLEAKLRLREQQLFGRKTETAPSTQPQLTGSPTTAGSPKRPRGQQRGQQGHGRRDYSHLPADIEDAELTGDDGCCPQGKRPFEPIGGTENSTVLEIEVRAPSAGCPTPSLSARLFVWRGAQGAGGPAAPASYCQEHARGFHLGDGAARQVSVLPADLSAARRPPQSWTGSVAGHPDRWLAATGAVV